MAVASVAAMFAGKISGEQFLVLAGMSFSYYFANKGNQENNFLNK